MSVSKNGSSCAQCKSICSSKKIESFEFCVISSESGYPDVDYGMVGVNKTMISSGIIHFGGAKE